MLANLELSNTLLIEAPPVRKKVAIPFCRYFVCNRELGGSKNTNNVEWVIILHTAHSQPPKLSFLTFPCSKYASRSKQFIHNIIGMYNYMEGNNKSTF